MTEAKPIADLTLIPCAEEYWEFVRALRTDPRTLHGFVQKADITPNNSANTCRLIIRSISSR